MTDSVSFTHATTQPPLPAPSQSTTPLPRDALALQSYLQQLNLPHDPAVLSALLEFSHNYIRDSLLDALDYRDHANRAALEVEDMEMALTNKSCYSFTTVPPKQVRERHRACNFISCMCKHCLAPISWSLTRACVALVT